ncbi:hypothetical protein E5676_scaffold863G001600 [Cucumis melo var. makuwa]|uniref:Uncharacterized protein n=1 Tax=Cucumis melo var. makuwa TaxID=1194695 RepID=A0A5A7V5K2_CUCMM|nr:hypothetical protein E6C27_scaffold348G00160 [Cucumis melo var. makuwa]TYK03775.1 hypothetical protein E5676_scaffold863G001600 [Cucumis melo var. makuwa]
MLSTVIRSTLGYPAFTVGMITDIPEVRPFWFSVTRERRTTQPTAPGGEESSSRCQTFPYELLGKISLLFLESLLSVE